jgi:hypothetical protein
MSSASLAGECERLGLERVAAAVRELPIYASLLTGIPQASHVTVAQTLDSMTDPVERALAAWDLLCTRIVDDHERVQLVSALQPVKAALPAPASQGLAAAASLRLPAPRGLDDASFASATLALHLSRSETVASYRCAWAHRSGAFEGALDLLAEVLLECGTPERIGHELEGELARYVAARTSSGVRPPERWDRRVEDLAREEPRLRVAEAELGMKAGQLPFPDRVVELVCAMEPDWRYGARVQALLLGWRSETRAALAAVDAFLARFGCDAQLFAGFGRRSPLDPLGAGLAERAAAQVRADPRGAAAWIALVERLALEPGVAREEIAGRLRAQCAFW